MPLSSISAECRVYSNDLIQHTHDYGQLILPLEGTLMLNTNCYDVQLTHEKLFYLPPQCLHIFHATTNNQLLVLDIPSFMLHNRSLSLDGILGEFDEKWNALRFLLLEESRKLSKKDRVLNELSHYALHLLQDDAILRSIRYMQTHFAQNLDINTLAAIEGISPTYYCEWFKKQRGVSPHHYLQQIRLQKAKELLRHTDLSILEIALEVGYSSHASLTRVFQKTEKQSPTAFRSQS